MKVENNETRNSHYRKFQRSKDVHFKNAQEN